MNRCILKNEKLIRIVKMSNKKKYGTVIKNNNQKLVGKIAKTNERNDVIK